MDRLQMMEELALKGKEIAERATSIVTDNLEDHIHILRNLGQEYLRRVKELGVNFYE